MAEVMRPIPFDRMLEWISGEYRKQRSIFGIPESCFFRKSSSSVLGIFGESCDTPVGPAAGPHTQLAQNIVAAYLAGGRFIELKTVQKLDSLKIEKPCIDARDEGYNTEWSTELSLEEAFDEYVKAWLLLHFLERALALRKTAARSFLFNLSVGYDLEGIRTVKMQSFLDGLMDASRHELYQRHLLELDAFVRQEAAQVFSADLSSLPGEISPRLSNSVTLSTMHGCPPHEIEAICSYLLQEKGLHTFVKLNPTLLGYEKVKALLEARGFGYIGIKEATFSNDLKYADAARMIGRLVEKSSACGRSFGVKLSNTLGARNPAGLLPGEEMYMSGRALFPLTISLAARLAREFQGALPISFSGGACQWNAPEVFAAGIRPITVATELLKPGGYLRLREIANGLEPLLEKGGKSGKPGGIDAEKLERICEDSETKPIYQKAWRGEKKVQVGEKLPLLDCYVAPCVRACPIHQDVPEYIRLAGAGRFDEALEVIYRTNPLPNITGHICDHQCMHNCTRKDYEGPVLIREIKRIAARHARRAYRAQGRRQAKRTERPGISAAVIGAGPAGLAASCFLARAGLKVTVFERSRSAGGVVGNILPRFRIPAAAIRRDIRTIESLGVDFRFGAGREFSIQALKTGGFKYIFIAIGAEVSRKLELAGDGRNVHDALSFLRSLRRDGRFAGLGRRVAVIGGGNTAVDSARAAKRLKGVEEVAVVYRRTGKEMPADREELDNAVRDGVAFEYLLSPEAFLGTGVLQCRRMRLGSPDSSGRRRAEPTEEIRELSFDSVISAIGEQADSGLLEGAGLKLGPEGRLKADPETLETEIRNVYVGGDAFRGPATVVESIADARRAAAAILARENLSLEGPAGSRYARDKERFLDIYGKKGRLLPALARHEHLRCLECDSVCNKCVDVCPNRANVWIAVKEEDGFRNAWQILHLDALCNECGNCGTFCPYDGLPYKDKLTLFSSKADFDGSRNDGFYVASAAGQPGIHLRLHGVPREPSAEGPVNREAEQALAIARTVLRDHGYLLSTSS